MYRMKSTLGPAAPGGYVQTVGVRIPFNEFQQINQAIAVCDQSQVLEVNDIAYELRTSIIAGNIVQILIFFLNTVAGGAWAELGAATPLDARTFTVLAEGE